METGERTMKTYHTKWYRIEYDEDGGGTVSDSEKEPIHHLRLVR